MQTRDRHWKHLLQQPEITELIMKSKKPASTMVRKNRYLYNVRLMCSYHNPCMQRLIHAHVGGRAAGRCARPIRAKCIQNIAERMMPLTFCVLHPEVAWIRPWLLTQLVNMARSDASRAIRLQVTSAGKVASECLSSTTAVGSLPVYEAMASFFSNPAILRAYLRLSRHFFVFRATLGSRVICVEFRHNISPSVLACRRRSSYKSVVRAEKGLFTQSLLSSRGLQGPVDTGRTLENNWTAA